MSSEEIEEELQNILSNTTTTTTEEENEDNNLIIILTSTFSVLIVIIILFILLRCRNKRRKKENNQKDEMLAQVISDNDDNNFENIEEEILRNGKPQSYDDDDLNSDEEGSVNSRTSISSFNTKERHTLDVHQCQSGMCLICKRNKKTQFELVGTGPNGYVAEGGGGSTICTTIIELEPRAKPNWWKTGQYTEDA